MKIVTVVGARPQFIKAAVVSRAIKDYNEKLHGKNQIREIIIHTGQHYDYNMSDIFFSEMQIPIPDYLLHVGGLSHSEMTGMMLVKIEKILLQEKPKVVLVFGDTDSTLAAALAAAKLHIPVAHIEAGLRSFNMGMPEEINRVLTDRISFYLFCPTMSAVQNLLVEGYGNLNVHINLVGDVMYDAVLFYKSLAHPTRKIELMLKKYEFFYLATVHRAENTDNPLKLREIIQALEKISEGIPVIVPIHPRTRNVLIRIGIETSNLILIDPIGYFDMLTLLAHATGVFTDSGGLQKEAYFFRKRCVILRDETEWSELVDRKIHILTGSNQEKIIKAEKNLKSPIYEDSLNLFGRGDAGPKIVEFLVNDIGLS